MAGQAAETSQRAFRLHTALYAQVLAAIMLGIALGAIWPDFAASLKPLADGFIKLVKMVISPVIFLTVVTGIAGMGDIKGFGRVGAKAFAYFIFFSTLALLIGLAVALIVRPGEGMNIAVASLDQAAVSDYVGKAHDASITAFLLGIIPTTMSSALIEGNILQVLFLAVLTGISITLVGEAAKPVSAFFESLSLVVFRVVAILMRAAPIGALGAMAFTIGKYGIASLLNLGLLVATFYLTSFLFVAVVLGLVAKANGFSLWRLLVYLRQELLLVLGTSSSEAALPNLMQKLERAGCAKPVVGLVVPAGYSFNLDGTNIYMTLAALFIAQACNIELSGSEIAMLLAVSVISSKGAAGVTGAGFITLAATLAIVPQVPIAGLAIILGVDRFMSECRSITNFIGNAVATVVVSNWEGALDRDRLGTALAGGTQPGVAELVVGQETDED